MPRRRGGRKKLAENIYRTEHNTYEVKLSIRGRQVKRTVKTFKEALELRRRLDLERELEESAESPEAQAPRMTLGEYMREIWAPRHVGTGRLAPETEQQYRDTLKWISRPARGLPDGLQGVPLGSIGRTHLAAWTALMAGSVKQSTARKHLKNVMRLMRLAKRDGLLKDLPDNADLLRMRPRAARESWVWRQEEVRAAIRYVRSRSDGQGLWEGHPVLLALLLFAGSGARKSEIFGLRWSDVELPGPQPFQPIASLRRPREGTATVTIRRQARWMGSKWRLDQLKTPSARRTIEIVHPTLVEALRRQWRLRYISGLNLVMTNYSPERGARPYGQGECPITTRILRAAAELGIRKDPETEAEKARGTGRPKSLHGLRHYFASQLLENGEDPVYVSKLLGHASPAITYAIYAWALRTSRPESTGRLQAELLDGLEEETASEEKEQ